MRIYPPELLQKKQVIIKKLRYSLNFFLGIGLLSAFYSAYLFHLLMSGIHESEQTNQVVHDFINLRMHQIIFFESAIILALFAIITFENFLWGYKELDNSEYTAIWNRVLMVNNPELTILVKDIYKRQGNILIEKNKKDFFNLKQANNYFEGDYQDFIKQKFN